MKNIIKQSSRFISAILLWILILSFTILPLRAYEGQYSAVNDRYGIRSSVNAGFRLTIPFGPTKRSKDRVKYGLQLSLRQEFNEGAIWNDYSRTVPGQSFNAEIMSLNFSERGFKELSLAGQPTFVYKDGVLMAVEEGEGEDQPEKKGSNTKWYVIGVVALGGLVLGAREVAKSVGETIGEIIVDITNGAGG